MTSSATSGDSASHASRRRRAANGARRRRASYTMSRTSRLVNVSSPEGAKQPRSPARSASAIAVSSPSRAASCATVELRLDPRTPRLQDVARLFLLQGQAPATRSQRRVVSSPYRLRASSARRARCGPEGARRLEQRLDRRQALQFAFSRVSTMRWNRSLRARRSRARTDNATARRTRSSRHHHRRQRELGDLGRAAQDLEAR